MLLQDPFQDWLGSLLRIVSLLVLYAFLTISGVATLDKFREINRADFSDSDEVRYHGLRVPFMVMNAIIICVAGVLIVAPVVDSPARYLVNEMISGSVLCILCMWLVIDITYHKNNEKNKFQLLMVSYGGLIMLLVLVFFVGGNLLTFVALFILYMNLELNGAAMWVLWELDPEENRRLTHSSLISYILVPVLLLLCPFFSHPAIQTALGISAINNALIVVYFSEFLEGRRRKYTIAGLIVFVVAISIALFLPNPVFANLATIRNEPMTTSLIVAIFIDAACFAYLLDMLAKRAFNFKKKHRLPALSVSFLLTLGCWGLLFLDKALFPIQDDPWALFTLSPTGWMLFCTTIFQTIAFGMLLSVALYDLPWIQAIIRWLRDHQEIFLVICAGCFLVLAVLLVITGIWPAFFSVFPTSWIWILTLWLVGLAMLGASMYGKSDKVIYLIFCYAGLGLATALVFAPFSMGIIGLIGLLILMGVLIFVSVTAKRPWNYTVPFMLGVLAVILTFVLAGARLMYATSNPTAAQAALIFEWFFAIIFAEVVIVVGFFLAIEYKEVIIVVFIAGLAMACMMYFIVFVWETKLSPAFSSSWVAACVALILPSLFVFFKYQWNALHKDKWSSVITSIIASVLVMIASGTKFTPGLSDFVNSIISMASAAGLVGGYFIYAKCQQLSWLEKDIAKLKAELKANPQDKNAAYGAWNKLGDRYYQKKDYDRAIDAYSEALKLYKNSARAREGIALCLQKKNERQGASP